MNVKEYISSGIVESYVLGLATEAERRDFEAACRQYPEIAAAREAFELSLEQQLVQDAPQPPAFLRSVLMEKIAEQPAASVSKEQDLAPVRKMNPWKWVAAASVILLAGALVWAFSLQKEKDGLAAANKQMEEELRTSEAALQAMSSDAELLQKPGMKMAAMTGTTDPGVYATIYWDTTSKDVYLMVNNLPKPASDKQYQLWALLDNKPIDLGMIEARQERLLYRMKGVQQAQAFAITLEQKGGSPAPTTSPIVVSKL